MLSVAVPLHLHTTDGAPATSPPCLHSSGQHCTLLVKSLPSLPGNLVSCADCCWQLCMWLVTVSWRAAAQAPTPGAECEGACAAAAARPRERRRGEGDRPAGLERQGSRSKDNPPGGEPLRSARTHRPAQAATCSLHAVTRPLSVRPAHLPGPRQRRQGLASVGKASPA